MARANRQITETIPIHVSRTGNGPAENVILSLLPVGSGNQPVSQNLGTVAAGAEKVIGSCLGMFR